MAVRIKTYRAGSAVFREGEVANAAYIVESGRVELSTLGPYGPVLLASLESGQMFGEMDIVTNTPRQSSARAADKSRIKVIPRDDFLDALTQKSDLALRVTRQIVQRLRAGGSLVPSREEMSRPGRSLIGRMISAFKRRREIAAVQTPAMPVAFTVLIAAMNDDTEGMHAGHTIYTLDGRPGLTVKVSGATLQMPEHADGSKLAALSSRARHLLMQEEADVVIWGDVDDINEQVCLHVTASGEEDRPGWFTVSQELILPQGFEGPPAELLYAAVLAAAEPAGEVQRQYMRSLLIPAAAAVADFAQRPSIQFTMPQQVGILTAWGHVAAACGSLEGSPDWLDQAAIAYDNAIRRLDRRAPPHHEAMLQRARAVVLTARAERDETAIPILEQAVAAWRAAAEVLPRAGFPMDWAGSQQRLGVALYKLDLRTGDSELLKQAFTAFQAALQVFTRAETPQRWADTMASLALALEVYGDQMRSPDVLDRAVEACRSVLELLSRDRTPLTWAGLQNTLGSALFLLDKHSNTTDHLDEAAQVLRAAIQVYRSIGAHHLAAVPEKNLAHVERLLKARQDRRVVSPHWAGER